MAPSIVWAAALSKAALSRTRRAGTSTSIEAASRLTLEQRVCGCLTAASVLVSLASTPSAVDVDGAALSKAVPSSTWWTSMASLSFLELRRVVGPTYLSALRPRCDRWKAFPVHDTPRNGADDAAGFASKV